MRENTVRAEVTECLAGARYRVKLKDEREVIAYAAGKVKLAKIRIVIGDIVEVVLDPYGGNATNRIVWRV